MLQRKRKSEMDKHNTEGCDTPDIMEDYCPPDQGWCESLQKKKKLKPSKRLKDSVFEEWDWERCKAGFDEEVIIKEKAVSNPTKKRGAKRLFASRFSKGLERTSSSASCDKDVDIDWESSSSDASDLESLPEKVIDPSDLLVGGRTRRRSITNQGQQQKKDSNWLKKTFGCQVRNAVENWMKRPSSSQLSNNSQAPELDISGCDSSDESNHVPDLPQKPLPARKAASPSQSLSIASYDPSTQEKEEGSPITGSQWIKKLKMGSPDKMAAELSDLRDSAKKKPRFVSNGLAERLQRLINREKSDIAFWHHQQPQDLENKLEGKTLIVRVETVRMCKGLYVTQCTDLTKNAIESVGDRNTSKDALDASRICETLEDQDVSKTTSASTEREILEKATTKWILFQKRTADEVNLLQGVVLKIHPPWQMLTLPGYSVPAILCTHFVRPVHDKDARFSSMHTEGPSQNIHIIPEEKIFKPCKLFPDTSSDIPSLPFDNASPEIGSLYGGRHVYDSILEAAANHSPACDSTFAVRAIVQKKYKRGNKLEEGTQQKRDLGFLIQDKEGTMCDLHLAADALRLVGTSTPPDDVQEGSVYEFNGLKVLQRTERSRCLSLFSVIDRIRNHQPMRETGEPNDAAEPEVDDMTNSLLPLQETCYILTMMEDGSVSLFEDEEATLSHFHCAIPNEVPLSQIIQNVPKRYSLFGKVVYSTYHSSTTPTKSEAKRITQSTNTLLFVTDQSFMQRVPENSSAHQSYLTIEVSPSFTIPERVAQSLSGQEKNIFYFKDVWCKTGANAVLDTFSSISLAVLPSESGDQSHDDTHTVHDEIYFSSLLNCRLVGLPSITEKTKEQSLCVVSGEVIGVDEETAYSWPVCDQCGNNQLIAKESSADLYCGKCGDGISSPILHYHLKIFIRNKEDNQEVTFKTMLQQDTIVKLLEDAATTDAYDLQRILGQQIGPLNCYVKIISKDLENKSFEVDEIP